VVALCVLLSYAAPSRAASITIADVRLFLHSDSGLTQLDSTSPQYSSTNGPNGLSSFGWTFTNTTLSVINNLRPLIFLDADIDRNDNTFFNEYGTFLSLALPATAPPGAIAATSWQIDEPGFVFGTIPLDLLNGTLTNTNTVPSSAPDDVSFALGFALPSLAPNGSFTIRMFLSDDLTVGLLQSDPDSEFSFAFNGYLTVASAPPPPPPGNEVPEPSTFGFMATGVAALLVAARKKSVKE